MIIFPRQLKVITELNTQSGLESIELLALPLRIRATVNKLDGTYKVIDIDDQGEIREVFSIP